MRVRDSYQYVLSFTRGDHSYIGVRMREFGWEGIVSGDSEWVGVRG
jgi:hypothetical protein